MADGSQTLIGAEIRQGGRYWGTQTPGGFHWAYGDSLGTVRARSCANSAANCEADTSGPWDDASNLQNGTSGVHFTGKLRDSETGLDDFGARYYSPALGRFLTPDWSDAPEPVPYADLGEPQSLNLYAYAGNNPVTNNDPDGHSVGGCLGSICNGQMDGFQLGDDLWSGSDPRELAIIDIGLQARQMAIAWVLGRKFGSLDAAGIAAERAYEPPSIKEEREYAGWIERTPDGKYRIDPANKGLQAASDPGLKPGKAAAEYHTHPGPDGLYDGENFSNADKWFYVRNEVTGYLGTPRGRILKYDPKIRVQILLKATVF